MQFVCFCLRADKLDFYTGSSVCLCLICVVNLSNAVTLGKADDGAELSGTSPGSRDLLQCAVGSHAEPSCRTISAVGIDRSIVFSAS